MSGRTPQPMPAHLGPHTNDAGTAAQAQPAPPRDRPPTPDPRNLSHTGNIGAEQADATRYLGMFHEGDANGQPGQPEHPAQAGANFDFIMNQQPKGRKPFNFGGSSMAVRLAVVAGGLLVLVILFSVVKGLLAGSDKVVPSMISVAQQQQVLTHLATNGAQNSVSDTLKNFSVTAQLSLSSEQNDVVAYLKTNGHKTSTKELNLKVNQVTDTQLTTALSASNFDSTYKTIMQSQLTAYEQTLQQALNQVSGPKGRTLLQADIKAAQLLVTQLGE